MEGYILQSLNLAERIFKRNFRRALGERELKTFEQSYREHFIQEEDIRSISRLGFNCIRVPFHYRIVEKAPYRFPESEALFHLDRAIEWAGAHKVWVILDLHAACGSQNHDWHSDSLGEANLWKKKEFQHRTFALWEFLADRYKDQTTVAGYDLLNEAVLADTQLLNEFYHALIKRIRKVDENHILFIEGNKWATDLDCLDTFEDDNLVLRRLQFHDFLSILISHKYLYFL